MDVYVASNISLIMRSCPVLGSLCCDSSDECKTLIPSLAEKISDEDLQELLDEMAKLMSA